jgi:hypothetical protein
MEFLSRIGLSSSLSLSPGNWYENLPGRIVALSFAIVASQYYLNIFSAITLRNVSKTAEFSMRLNAFCFAGPILWALVYRPKDWAICSAIGIWIVSLNNLIMYRMARFARKKISESFSLPPSSALPPFFTEFETWWVDMFSYGIGIMILALLFYFKKARDEWMYTMGIAVVINILVILRSVCIVKAPMMRAGLDRLFSGLERAKRKEGLAQGARALRLGPSAKSATSV